MNRFTRNTLIIACVLAALAILMGAFGAHALKSRVTPEQLSVFHTGVTYHFYHVFALLFLALLSLRRPYLNLRPSVILFLMGILLFSGSLYMISTRDIHGISTSFIGPITPIGGILFVVGWLLLAYRLIKDIPQKEEPDK